MPDKQTYVPLIVKHITSRGVIDGVALAIFARNFLRKYFEVFRHLVDQGLLTP